MINGETGIIITMPRVNAYGREVGHYEYTLEERIEYFTKALAKAEAESVDGDNQEYVDWLVAERDAHQKIYDAAMS